jgi:hypothetical protein
MCISQWTCIFDINCNVYSTLNFCISLNIVTSIDIRRGVFRLRNYFIRIWFLTLCFLWRIVENVVRTLYHVLPSTQVYFHLLEMLISSVFVHL